jgi:origin recognition complex subunit 2
VLAEHQLQNSSEPYMSYKEYFEKCREKFLVNNEITMRTQLTEFRDHKVIITKKPRNSDSGGIHFTIPVGSSLLAQILDEMEE